MQNYPPLHRAADYQQHAAANYSFQVGSAVDDDNQNHNDRNSSAPTAAAAALMMMAVEKSQLAAAMSDGSRVVSCNPPLFHVIVKIHFL